MMHVRSITIEGARYELREFKEIALSNQHNPGRSDWERSVYRFIGEWISDESQIIQYSSGTTGQSKKIVLSKKSMEASARATCRFFGLQQGQSALLCLPVDYIAGKMMIVRAISCGLNLLLEEPSGNPDLRPGHTGFTALVPMQLATLIKNNKAYSLPEKLIVGGAEISQELAVMVRDLPGLVYATYGMAETCSHVALQKLNGPDRQQDFHALPGICLSQDDRDCLVIEASYLSIPVVTNDIITFTGPASFIWRGRFDNLINSGGIKLVPEEMEALIREKTGRECAVIGVTDPVLGQQAVVFLEEESDFQASQAEPAIKALFPGNAKPKEIIVIPGLPRNDSMKIDRRMLQDLMRP